MALFKDRPAPGEEDDSRIADLTLIDRDITIIGEIISEGNVSTSGSVVIEPNASVRGDITAQNLIVEGTIEGTVVVARKFELRPTGWMRGDIRASVVAIAEDSFLKGKVLATEKISTNAPQRRVEG